MGMNRFVDDVYATLKRPVADTAQRMHNLGITPRPIEIGAPKMPVQYYHDQDMGTFHDAYPGINMRSGLLAFNSRNTLAT